MSYLMYAMNNDSFRFAAYMDKIIKGEYAENYEGDISFQTQLLSDRWETLMTREGMYRISVRKDKTLTPTQGA